MMEDNETLDAFVARTQQELADFEKSYRDGNSVAPDQWPLEMGAGDWDEQFLAHLS